MGKYKLSPVYDRGVLSSFPPRMEQADSKGKNKGNFTCQAGIKNSMSLKGKRMSTEFLKRLWGAHWGGYRYYSPELLEVSGCQWKNWSSSKTLTRL